MYIHMWSVTPLSSVLFVTAGNGLSHFRDMFYLIKKGRGVDDSIHNPLNITFGDVFHVYVYSHPQIDGKGNPY